jgi:hypothetical protein
MKVIRCDVKVTMYTKWIEIEPMYGELKSEVGYDA